jgi:hypothetical protein
MGEVFALWERGRISSEQFKEALQSQRLSLEVLKVLKSGVWKFENLQQQGLLRSSDSILIEILEMFNLQPFVQCSHCVLLS